MNKTTLWALTVALFTLSAVLSFFIYRTVREPIEERERIEAIERQVIRRLELIRRLQQAYQARYGCYASSWQRLVQFALSDSIYNIARYEEDLGNDSVIVTLDTLSVIAVRDSLLKGMSNEQIARLPISPATQTDTFALYVGQTENFGNRVCLIFVEDPAPVNPDRKRGKRPNLAFGSTTELTTRGTWEF